MRRKKKKKKKEKKERDDEYIICVEHLFLHFMYMYHIYTVKKKKDVLNE